MIRHASAIGRTVIMASVVTMGRLALALSLAPPCSYTQATPDGRHVFVMISPLTPEEEASSWEEPFASEIRVLRRTYKESGLYRTDGTADPLWTVDWYCSGVKVLSDGVHLVRLTSWASDGEEAVAFFARGRKIRSYTVEELMLFPALKSGPFWTDESSLDDSNARYEISTVLGERYVFDVTTGAILSSYSPAESDRGYVGRRVVRDHGAGDTATNWATTASRSEGSPATYLSPPPGTRRFAGAAGRDD